MAREIKFRAWDKKNKEMEAVSKITFEITKGDANLWK